MDKPPVNQWTGRKKASIDNVDRELLKALKQSNQPDEDGIFFGSLSPFLKTMTSDEKLEFRIIVMGYIQEIKVKLLQQYPSTSSTPVTSPTNNLCIVHVDIHKCAYRIFENTLCARTYIIFFFLLFNKSKFQKHKHSCSAQIRNKCMHLEWLNGKFWKFFVVTCLRNSYLEYQLK